MTIHAHGFKVLEGTESTRVSCRLDADGFPDELFFDVRSSLLGPLAASEPNWALVALLYPAMLSGRDLLIEADISQSLWHAAQNDLQGLLQACDSRLKKIRVMSGLAPVATSRAAGVATGFSAGIDSFTTLSLFSGDEVPESLKITCLTVHNVGAFGKKRISSENFSRACDRAKEFCQIMNLDNAFIHSNIDEVFASTSPPSRVFENTHSFRNAAVAHVLHDSIGCFLYSSAHPYEEIGVAQLARSSGKSTAYIDPILLPLLSTERMWLISAGASLSRGEKTRRVADNEFAPTHLDVCVRPEDRQRLGIINCSRCWKCVRTMATLEAIGELDRFSAVFDVTHYRTKRRKLMNRLVWNAVQGNDLDKEVVEMLKTTGRHVPGRLQAYGWKLKSVLGRAGKKVVKSAWK